MFFSCGDQLTGIGLEIEFTATIGVNQRLLRVGPTHLPLTGHVLVLIGRTPKCEQDNERTFSTLGKFVGCKKSVPVEPIESLGITSSVQLFFFFFSCHRRIGLRRPQTQGTI